MAAGVILADLVTILGLVLFISCAFKVDRDAQYDF
jgi:hypothetical protein